MLPINVVAVSRTTCRATSPILHNSFSSEQTHFAIASTNTNTSMPPCWPCLSTLVVPNINKCLYCRQAYECMYYIMKSLILKNHSNSANILSIAGKSVKIRIKFAYATEQHKRAISHILNVLLEYFLVPLVLGSKCHDNRYQTNCNIVTIILSKTIQIMKSVVQKCHILSIFQNIDMYHVSLYATLSMLLGLAVEDFKISCHNGRNFICFYYHHRWY